MISFERIQDLPDLRLGLKQMLEAYIVGSGEMERTPENMFQEISQGIKAGAAFWLIRSVGRSSSAPSGFLFVDQFATAYGKKAVFIHHLFIEPDVKEKLYVQIHVVLDIYAREIGATEMFCTTRRNPLAWARRARHGWRLDSFVLKRKIS